MKSKFFLFIFLFFAGKVITAQEPDTLKAKRGKWGTELNMNLSDNELSLNNLINQIKVRTYVGNNTALRIGVAYNSDKSQSEYKNAYGIDPIENKTTLKTNFIGLALGFEQHFKGTRRLSPYLGSELSFGLKKTESEIENEDYIAKTEGALVSTQYINTDNGYYIFTSYDELGYTSAGINLIAGFDFYIAKNFFIGYEITYGYEYKKHQTIKTTYTDKDPSEPLNNLQNTGKTDGNESSTGFKMINGIRIGFVF